MKSDKESIKRKKEKIIAEMNANDKKCADEVLDLKDTFKKILEEVAINRNKNRVRQYK